MWADLFIKATQVYKPGSVLTAIYLVLQSLARSSRLLGTIGPIYMSLHGVAPDRVYSTPMFPWSECALTAPFHPYPCGRYLSVALVLRSPSAGITCYPCPVEPGLSSPACFHTAAAAVRPGRTRYCTLRNPSCQMSCKFFFKRLYYKKKTKFQFIKQLCRRTTQSLLPLGEGAPVRTLGRMRV